MNHLEFNGHRILYKIDNEVVYIALKPICEAFNVSFVRQLQRIKKHRIFGPVYTVQYMQIPGSQRRNMACLPEEYIYGWLFSINSKSENLVAYQRECNHLLFQHFRGSVLRQARLYEKLACEKNRTQTLKRKLQQDPTFRAWEASKRRSASLKKNLKIGEKKDMELFSE